MSTSVPPPDAIPGASALTPGSGSGEKGLKGNALGLFSSVAIGLASTAPAYSLAATLGLIVAGVGLQAPIITILAFIPMLLIAYAYKEMNAVDPDCGTTFTWAARAFGPRTGWMGGWGIIIADIIVMANLAQIAGSYGFQLIGHPGLASNTTWTTIAGVVWIIVMTFICYIGIEISAALQRVLLCVEVAMLAIFSVTALVKAYGSNAPATAIRVQAAWFNPFHVPTASALTAGILSAVFIYWGWDTAVSVNEETADKTRTPGRAAVMSTVLLLLIYTLVSTSAQSFAGVGTDGIGLANPNNSGDVLSGLGNAVFGTTGFGWFLSKLLIFMVLTSAAASTQTTILPTARTSFSMALHKAIPSHFGRVHPRFMTPTWSTVGMGMVSIAFYVLLTRISTNVLTDSISSVGLGIAFYYGLTGFACFWYFRKVLTRSAKDLWFKGILPLLGGLILLYFFCYAAFDVYASPTYGHTTVNLPFFGETGGVTVIGVGAVALGLVLMAIQWAVQGSWFRNPDVPVSAATADEGLG
ncbi:amino acid transporter [Streptacidiphilus sp. MAP12-20]|uniref:APC family permease n=1 Tax=Streptacidiphilus sp. MAP12-20 TaxID=3156299 RepID=UPI00351819D8